jgi:hypothetical protein
MLHAHVANDMCFVWYALVWHVYLSSAMWHARVHVRVCMCRWHAPCAILCACGMRRVCAMYHVRAVCVHVRAMCEGGEGGMCTWMWHVYVQNEQACVSLLLCAHVANSKWHLVGMMIMCRLRVHVACAVCVCKMWHVWHFL